MVPELARSRSAGTGVLSHPFVDGRRGDSRLDALGDGQKSRRSDSTRATESFHVLPRMNFDTHPSRVPLRMDPDQYSFCMPLARRPRAILRRMSFAQLHYFIAVAEEENLTRAAARLHISQPPLTRQIKSLEEELGVELFNRSKTGMRLLPPGRLLLDEARAITSRVQALPALIRPQPGLEATHPGAAELPGEDGRKRVDAFTEDGT